MFSHWNSETKKLSHSQKNVKYIYSDKMGSQFTFLILSNFVTKGTKGRNPKHISIFGSNWQNSNSSECISFLISFFFKVSLMFSIFETLRMNVQSHIDVFSNSNEQRKSMIETFLFSLRFI